MKAKIKKDLSVIVEKTIAEYSEADVETKGKILANLVKEVNTLKEIENQEVDISIKKNRLKLDQDRLQLDRDKQGLEEDKFIFDREKFEETKLSEELKSSNEISKLELEKDKLKFEIKTSKNDKIFNGIMKGLEIGVPLVVNTMLTLMLFRLIYKDDGRAPSELKDLMKHVYKK